MKLRNTPALLAALLFCACPDEEADDGDHTGHVRDGGEEDIPCTSDYPAYEQGLSMQAGELTVTLVSAQPGPPRQKVKNDWVLSITDADGAPIRGATILNAESYMEAHRHYGMPPPSVSEQSEPGEYAFDDIDFMMRGPWEVVFDVEPEGGSQETVRFKICVE